MPCNSDYMEPSSWEVDLSAVACVLDELAGRSVKHFWWEGHHPKIYNKGLGTIEADRMVADACRKLTKRGGADGLSLEAQIWWRDHQAADRERIKREEAQRAKDALKQKALWKLTPEERKALGIK